MEQDFSLFHFFQDLVEVGMKDSVNTRMTSSVSLGEDLVVGSDQLWWLSLQQYKSPCRAACSALPSDITHPIPELQR